MVGGGYLTPYFHVINNAKPIIVSCHVMTDNQFSSGEGRKESKCANNNNQSCSHLIEPSLEGGDVEGGGEIRSIGCDVNLAGH